MNGSAGAGSPSGTGVAPGAGSPSGAGVAPAPSPAPSSVGPAPSLAPSPVPPAPSPLAVREAQASSVIVQRVPADRADAFMEWQHGIAAAAAAFPGFHATELYPPAEEGDEWVIVLHFDDHAALQGWLDSAARAEWVARLPHDTRDFRVETMAGSFGSWVAGRTAGTPVRHWQSFLLVLVGLYPTVMLLAIFLSPRTEPLGLAFAMLIGNVASVAFLEWVGMPLLNRALGPWLRARGPAGRRVLVGGTALVLVALAAMAIGFRLVTG